MMEPIKPLSNLITECGETAPDIAHDVLRRDFHLSGVRYINDDNINEKIFVDIMKSAFTKKRNDMWFESRVNLWDFINLKDPYEALTRFNHPLQPDIDLLYCNIVNGKREAPIVGVEVKLFSRYSGYGRKIPKTTGYEGFYAGLDEAVSLLLMGLDYVYLWHVQVLPQTIWQRLLKYGNDFFRKVSEESMEIGGFGGALLGAMISGLEIPIGYLHTFLITQSHFETFRFLIDKRLEVPAEMNPLSSTKFGESLPTEEIRQLLLESFNIKSIRKRKLYMVCSRCAFQTRKDFKYCPVCGAKLESKI